MKLFGKLKEQFVTEALPLVRATAPEDYYATQHQFKDALSGLRQFLAIESPLKMMKNVFYFTLKSICVLKIFKLFSWLFGHVEKRLD